MLWPILSSLGEPKERNSVLQNRTFYFGESQGIFIYTLSDGPIKLAQKKEKKTFKRHLI
jgi:hypothetical protein